jgi:hypothetical protein
MVWRGGARSEQSKVKPMARPRKITQRKRRQYCASLAEGASYTDAAEKIGVTRQAISWVREHDPEFDREVRAARDVATTILVDTAWTRAVHGMPKPIYQGGKLVGYVQEYSDGMLAMLLKAYLPELFKDRVATELTGANGGAVKVQDMMPLEVQQRLAAILQRFRGRQDSAPPLVSASEAVGGYPGSAALPRLTASVPTQNGGPSEGDANVR